MRIRQFSIPAVLCLLFGNMPSGGSVAAESGCAQMSVDQTGTIHTAACTVPFTALASPEAKKIFIEDALAAQALTPAAKPPEALSISDVILKVRRDADATRKSMAEAMTALFPVTISSEMIGGVQTDVVLPREGISQRNKDRVLINLHGGGMIFGARYEGQVMSIPIASIGKIKVITVNYRMAPEHRFPAASEDVAAVYSALLQRYRSENIGIYGCSAGGGLTAQSAAWFQAHHLPRPGALGILCYGQSDDGTPFAGDSYYAATTPAALHDATSRQALTLYASDASPSDPLLNPFVSADVLSKFPPTLFISATRDFSMSSMIYDHIQLVKAGVDAELYLWDGLDHAFMYDPRLPESHEAYDVIVSPSTSGRRSWRDIGVVSGIAPNPAK